MLHITLLQTLDGKPGLDYVLYAKSEELLRNEIDNCIQRKFNYKILKGTLDNETMESQINESSNGMVCKYLIVSGFKEYETCPQCEQKDMLLENENICPSCDALNRKNDYESGEIEITKENIHLYYEYMEESELTNFSSSLDKLFQDRFINVASKIAKELNRKTSEVHCYWSNIKASVECDKSFIFGVKDLLKPIDKYIEEIKKSDEYHKFIKGYKIVDKQEALVILEKSELKYYNIVSTGEAYKYKNILEISNNTFLLMIGEDEQFKIPKLTYQTKAKLKNILKKVENKIFYKEV